MIHKRSGNRQELTQETFEKLSKSRAYRANFRFETVDIYPEITKLSSEEIIKKIGSDEQEEQEVKKKKTKKSSKK
jgi:hypothetical protein